MIERKILKWMAAGDTGISSEAMAFTACNIEPEELSPPCDPRDLYRCMKLVEAVPEIREHFTKIEMISKKWMKLITHWDELTRCLNDEVGDWDKHQSRKALKTFKLMKELGVR
ncbi:hypothetical protein [Neptuniibacter sp. QD37_11]|uniref:hypothetical protein n=1 Tax=Neptuniibacter sp. QD37_11 TaxID=3398209 RepID=UPI0039F5A790